MGWRRSGACGGEWRTLRGEGEHSNRCREPSKRDTLLPIHFCLLDGNGLHATLGAMKRAVAFLLLLLTTGCFLSRTYLDSPVAVEALVHLAPGETTAAQVVQALGAPMEVVQLGKRSAYRYEHALAKSATLTFIVVTFSNNDQQFDRTWVFFDENDVLTHVGSTLRTDTAEWALPWFDHD